MTTTLTIWQEVQRHRGEVALRDNHGALPIPQAGEARIRILGAGICGADVRVVGGNKLASGDPNAYTTLGHEGTGLIEELGPGETWLAVGDQVVVLPHHFPSDHATYCTARSIEPGCIGNGHSEHLGWDRPGIFSDYHVAPVTHLVRIDPTYLLQAEREAPHVGTALYAFTEPMLCVLSAYELLDRQMDALERPRLTGGRALVLGCGPIGVLHALALRKRGFAVWLSDPATERVKQAQWCLTGGNAYAGEGDFDLVIVTASSAAAIKMGESLVRDKGTVYLFAGLNLGEREQHDASVMLLYERVHRAAQGLYLNASGKRIMYLGHSGYFDYLAPQAVAMVAANAGALGRAITGVIPGWASPVIVGQHPGIVDWRTADDSPALLAVLRGLDVRASHCKLIVTTTRA
ncbi:MAG: alcohol dehydrogenase catalytic domain-containing protein [Ktedonobacterales bacterium]|nr:alcohol dehydrogenase catalytic domain-containing protein [Ktedonobacterales bacterium]